MSPKKVYMNIQNGCIVYTSESGNVFSYDYVRGYVIGIYSKILSSHDGDSFVCRYVDMYDPETGIMYTLGLRSSSRPWRDIIYSLGMIANFGHPIIFLPYREEFDGGYCNRVYVLQCGRLVDKVSEVPSLEPMQIDENIVFSDERRETFIEALIDQVNIICHKNNTTRYES